MGKFFFLWKGTNPLRRRITKTKMIKFLSSLLEILLDYSKVIGLSSKYKMSKDCRTDGNERLEGIVYRVK